MAKSFLTPITMNNLEVQNFRVHNNASALATNAGQMWYDSSNNLMKWYNGTGWIDALARANHSGTQAASTISDLATVVKAYKLSEFAAPIADVAMGGYKITGLAAPVAGTDAANKQYVDDTVAGLSWKNEVRVATTAAGTLASSFANGSSVDSVTLVTGDRILIKDQATQTENGIYTVNASGAPTRATDANTGAEVSGAAVYVTNGTSNQGSRWLCNVTGTIALGSTNLTFVQFAGGASYTAGNGLQLNTNQFSILLDSTPGLSVSGTGLKVLLDTNPGLTATTGLKVQLQTNPGLTLDATGLAVQLQTTSGMSLGASGLAIGAGNGITVGASTISVNLAATSGMNVTSGLAIGAGTGITVNASTIQVDTAVVVRKYAVDVGNGALTSITVTHNLGTLDVTVGVFANSGGAEVMCDVTHATTNTVTLGFAVAPTSNQYRCVVHG